MLYISTPRGSVMVTLLPRERSVHAEQPAVIEHEPAPLVPFWQLFDRSSAILLATVCGSLAAAVAYAVL